MKKNLYDIIKQSFYEINEHYLKFISALALQAFLLIASFLFLPPFGVVAAFLVMIITQIGLSKYSLKILNKKQEQIKEIFTLNKFTFSHVVTFIIKTFHITFFSLFLIVPGIMKCLEYSQTDFVLADNPKLDTSEALLQSRKLTHNSKGRVLMLFVMHLFLSVVLIAFSSSVVILTSLVVSMSQTFMIYWFAIMSVFLVSVISLPFYTISRTILYDNLKTLNKFNKTPEKNFMQEVAHEFMTAFKPNKKTKTENQTSTNKTEPSLKTKTSTTQKTTVTKKTASKPPSSKSRTTKKDTLKNNTSSPQKSLIQTTVKKTASQKKGKQIER